ncbi:Trypanosomal VSG domain containing protein, putative [Trypanosoma equiperdum]|uniref:Trypanosomal VSG domain containing protein, putative n=1 Tax=Trypanosoma equiperdum TaxID=5694 RepID=A0A1G4IL41_TRYEQ|nr:Trypanosomal VSG domain containing protein, putative [Trypanosoma equiperdum]
MTLTLLLAGITLILTADKASTAAENLAEFRAICELHTLVTQKLAESKMVGATVEANLDIEDERRAAMRRITRLNLTSLPENMAKSLAKLSDATPITDLDDEAKHGKEFKGLPAEVKRDMYDQTLKINKGDSKLKEYLDLHKEAVVKGTRRHLQPMAKRLEVRAEALSSSITAGLQKAREKLKAARQNLLTALYGSAKTEMQNPTDADSNNDIVNPKGTNGPITSTNIKDYCEPSAGTGNTAGDSLAGDMVCLCAGQGSSDSNKLKYCAANGVSGLEDNADSAGPTKSINNYKALKATCKAAPGGSAEAVTPAKLQTAVTAVLSELGKNEYVHTAHVSSNDAHATSQAILGVYTLNAANDPKCESNHATPLTQTSMGVCVNYFKRLKAENKIPWATHITAAAQELTVAADSFSQTLSQIVKLDNVSTEMKERLLLPTFISSQNQPQMKQGQVTPHEAQQNKCKNPPKQTTEGCSAIDCDYDASSDNKRIPNPFRGEQKC